ncbi:MAG: FG-GAP repeat protein [Planctomycetes bacterium]|nr:FG-GAP repeat protein [Planctomycetota bacterium]MBI3844767.1 FG-GAP repeat protein [Planctomycetota bacterium]
MRTGVSSSRPIGLALCTLGLSTAALAQSSMPAVFGGPGDQLGYAVSGAGDVNGDGIPDVVIGAPYAGVGENHVRVYSGVDCSLLWTLTDASGPGTGGAMGWSVASIGDVDGDGASDLVVGAPSASVVHAYDGSAIVVSGRTGQILFSFHGDRDNDRFGASVAGAGDVDRDGVPDVIVGTEAPLSRRGYVRILSGVDGSTLFTLWEPNSPDENGQYGHFGATVSGAGDVDRDGFADVIVGASLGDGSATDSGIVTIFSGRDGHVIHSLFGSARQDYLGTSVSGAGDVDGDGYADVVVGAPGYTDPTRPTSDDVGLARVYSGRTGTVLYDFTGDVRDRFFGMAVSGAGDVNGDGFADVVAGSFGYPLTVSIVDYVRVFSGRDGATLFTMRGDALHDGFGWAVAAAGDVNGDGFADVVVGAYKDDTAGTRAGSATVYLGHSDSGLVITAPSPGVAGQFNSLDAIGAAPGATIRFVYGRRLGKTALPAAPGLMLSIASPTLGPTAIAEADGRVTAHAWVPAGQSGRRFLLQAVDLGHHRVSNLLTVTLR